jgi:hypothetical protein
MVTVKFVVDGTAMDLLTSIAQNIKNDVELFLAEKKENGSLESFKKLTPFAQRIEFFEETTDYKVYRNALRQWILYGEISRCGDWGLPHYNETLNLIEADAAKRAGQVYDLKWNRVFRREGWEEANVKTLMEMRRTLLEENPILSDQNIDIADRRHLMNLALCSNKQYQRYQKNFDYMVKKAISSLITWILLDEENHPWTKDYKRVVEGL